MPACQHPARLDIDLAPVGDCQQALAAAARIVAAQHVQLPAPERGANGYREYGEAHVDVVLQITGLLDAGLPTRIIKQLGQIWRACGMLGLGEAES